MNSGRPTKLQLAPRTPTFPSKPKRYGQLSMIDFSTAHTPATSTRSSATDVLKSKQAKAVLAATKRYEAELENTRRILSEEEFSRVEEWLSVHKLKTSYSMLLIRTSLLVDIYTEKLERNGEKLERKK